MPGLNALCLQSPRFSQVLRVAGGLPSPKDRRLSLDFGQYRPISSVFEESTLPGSRPCQATCVSVLTTSVPSSRAQSREYGRTARRHGSARSVIELAGRPLGQKAQQGEHHEYVRDTLAFSPLQICASHVLRQKRDAAAMRGFSRICAGNKGRRWASQYMER